MTWAWIGLALSACGATGFVFYWLGVGNTERRLQDDHAAILDQYKGLRSDANWLRDQLIRHQILTREMVNQAGLLSPTEREAFDTLTRQWGAA
jgi:hypothetical protein